MPTLNWIGKDKVINHHLDVPFRTLKKEYSFSPDGSDDGNMIIHGDNLEASVRCGLYCCLSCFPRKGRP